MRPNALIAAAMAAFVAAAAQADDLTPKPRPETPPAAESAPAELKSAAGPTVQCLAEAVYFEARGTSERSRAAVAHVVLNRADAPEFPDTPCEVVEQGCQFSYNCDGKPEALTVREDREEALETAEKVVEGETPDPTDGALFFHGEGVAPEWAASFEPTAEIGGHIFYR